MAALTTCTFKKGEIIFNVGDFERCMYVIDSGVVGIYAFYGTDKEIELTKLEPKRYFGEMGLIESTPRSATAVALADCELLKITEDDFQELLKTAPDVIIDIYKNLNRRVKELSDDYIEVCNDITTYVDLEELYAPSKENLWTKIKKLIEHYDKSSVSNVYVDSQGNAVSVDKL